MKVPITLVAMALLLAPWARGQTPSVGPLAAIDGRRGLVLHGEGGLAGGQPIPGELGASIAYVDANGDGFDDVLIGAPSLAFNPIAGVSDNAGHAYLLFGGPGTGAPGAVPKVSLTTLPVGVGIDFVGQPGDRAGSSVANAGDVNGDGLEDFIIGAAERTEAGRTRAGGAYVVFGSLSLDTIPTTQVLTAVAASGANRGVYLRGARAFGLAGSSVSGGIDANGDGRDDVVLGAPFDSTDGFVQNGTATVVYGQAGWPSQTVVDLLGLGAGARTEVRGTESFDLLGAAVAGIGAFDPVLPMTAGTTDPLGDDVAIGAPGLPAVAAGAVYVLRGEPGAPAASYLATDFGNGPNTAGLVYTGAAVGDQTGASVASAGDLLADADGHAELFIGAPRRTALGKPQRGAIYLVAGARDGVLPQGFDLATTGTVGDHVAIYGLAPGDGVAGVHAATLGDWTDDGIAEVVLGFPAARFLNSSQVPLPLSGRVRVIDGSALQSGGVLDLDFAPAGIDLIELGGETASARAGAALATGDHDGDGVPDFAVGAPGAPSDPSPSDPTGLAFTRTGRGHVLLGPAFRVGDVTPASTWFDGPTVTIDALNLVEPFELFVGADEADIVSFQTGNNGFIVFEPPQPPAFGAAVPLQINTPLGDGVSAIDLQFVELSVGAPEPARGLPGQEVRFAGSGISTASDMTVEFDGWPAQIASAVPLAGDLTVILPVGPQLNVPLDVTVSSSNGFVLLPDAFEYRTIMIQSVTPASGPADSGIEDPNVMGAFKGTPATLVDVAFETLMLPPSGLLLDVRKPGGPWIPLTITSSTQISARVSMPFMLEGPVETLADIRIRDATGADILVGAYTYLAGDFRELTQYAQPGLGSVAPRLLMAGQATPGQNVLITLRDLATGTQLAGFFVGLTLQDPPNMSLGGPLGVLAEPWVLAGMGTTPISVSAPVPAGLADGTKIYLQAVTVESAGNPPMNALGFSNVIEVTADVAP